MRKAAISRAKRSAAMRGWAKSRRHGGRRRDAPHLPHTPDTTGRTCTSTSALAGERPCPYVTISPCVLAPHTDVSSKQDLSRLDAPNSTCPLRSHPVSETRLPKACACVLRSHIPHTDQVLRSRVVDVGCLPHRTHGTQPCFVRRTVPKRCA